MRSSFVAAPESFEWFPQMGCRGPITLKRYLAGILKANRGQLWKIALTPYTGKVPSSALQVFDQQLMSLHLNLTRHQFASNVISPRRGASTTHRLSDRKEQGASIHDIHNFFGISHPISPSSLKWHGRKSCAILARAWNTTHLLNSLLMWTSSMEESPAETTVSLLSLL